MSAFLPVRTAALDLAIGARHTLTAASATSTLRASIRAQAAIRSGNSGDRRTFCATGARGSKLGRTPISVPPGVDVKVGELWVEKDLTTHVQRLRSTISITGPLGKIEYNVPDFVRVEVDEVEKEVKLSIRDEAVKQQREMWGTTWAYINRHIMGVSEGHTAVLRLVGIGYRAAVEDRPAAEAEYPGQKLLSMKLGYTHPVNLGVPKGVTASTPNPTRILLEGIEREKVMSFAGKIREWRKPEPYKGKGVFINDETIKLKQKKIK